MILAASFVLNHCRFADFFPTEINLFVFEMATRMSKSHSLCWTWAQLWSNVAAQRVVCTMFQNYNLICKFYVLAVSVKLLRIANGVLRKNKPLKFDRMNMKMNVMDLLWNQTLHFLHLQWNKIILKCLSTNVWITKFRGIIPELLHSLRID